MSLDKFDLKEYDMIVAVTQNAINKGLASYLAGLKKHVALYYKMEDGAYVPTDPASALLIFKGTLSYTLDSQGKPVDIVELYTDKGSQTIRYNITFSEATFVSKLPGMGFNLKQVAGDPWRIRFLVELRRRTVSLSDLPEPLKNSINKAVGG